MSAPDSLAGALAFTAQRFVAIATELDEARAKLAAVEAALLMGGQSAEVRCRAALVALGCDKAANNISVAECQPAESTFCPRDHGCALPAGHDGDCSLTAALCFCDECEAKL